ncbi:MAG: AmmeMemoRadiSam system protein B [Thermotogaceae bacterium]|nr:AmmeMemoRadiSam system protein B [Thermotogaceae bacterium]
MVRKPVVAGMFYPSSKKDLILSIENAFSGSLGPGKLPEKNSKSLPKPVGVIVPHAGYVYSGQVAAWAYYELSKKGKPQTAILIGPNHTGYGKPVSIFPGGKWQTPLGNLEVDENAVQILLENSDMASSDTAAHTMEHSLEVQLPFLQYLYGNSIKIVPITMLDQSPKAAADLSKAISVYLSLYPNTVVIASTDLNHYDDHETTVRKDKLIIEAIESGDPRILYTAIYEANVSMCGYGPVTTLMLLNLGRVRILKHATSGEISGDFLEVVGYLSAIYE